MNHKKELCEAQTNKQKKKKLPTKQAQPAKESLSISFGHKFNG